MTTTNIKALETEYHNTLFRSRLEARWAICFDQLDLRWEYEPEAFGNGEMGYLPDFYLPQFDAYFEIKPDREFSHDKIGLAVLATGRTVYVGVGRPNVSYGCDACKPDMVGAWIVEIAPTGKTSWDQTGAEECENEPLSFCMTCFSEVEEGLTLAAPIALSYYRKKSDRHSHRLHAAYQAARRHRFWNPA